VKRLEENLAVNKKACIARQAHACCKGQRLRAWTCAGVQGPFRKVDYVGVAVLEEGILLRKLGIKAPIIVLGGIWNEQIQRYLTHNLP